MSPGHGGHRAGDEAGGQGHESDSPWSCCRFHLAAMRGNVDCLEAMLAHGVDAMTKDSSGEGMATTRPWLTPWTSRGHLVVPTLPAGVEAEGTEVTPVGAVNCPSFLWGFKH